MKNTQNSLGRVSSGLRLALLAGVVALSPASWAQKAYPTPEAAADAFIDGVGRNDGDAIKVVLGADWKKFIPLDTVDGGDVTNFLEAWSKGHKIVAAGADKAFVEVGVHGWTMPIPLAKSASGWSFDTKQAPDEMRTRRIGRNELAAIQSVLAYTDAQNEYAARDHDGDGVKEYAQKILSSEGKRDGLYWPTLADEPPSPLGPVMADSKPIDAFHGYFYRILTAQGKDAPGGAKSYVVNGNMTGGYALVAWPAKWNDTGVMTFIVSKDGVVYQKDLGANTAAMAKAMPAYNPDSTWTKASAK
jgi:hypothetical protein